MKSKMKIGILLILAFAFFTAGCVSETASPTPKPTVTAAPTTSPPATTSAPTTAPPTGAPVDKNLVAHGGRLYDKWWKEMKGTEPTGDQPLWATQSSNTRSGADTWRCKECHGWDYMGVDGAYGSGSHKTGFSGVYAAAQSKSTEELKAAMKSGDHDFTATLSDVHIEHVVLYLKNGLVDLRKYIDYSTKKPISANADNGKEKYDQVCSLCHGPDGRMINFHTEEEPEYVGTLANDNPWEFTHKVRNGQPDSAMPSAIVNGWSMQDVMDVLAYAQTLPTEAAAQGAAVADIAAGGRLYDKWWKEAGVAEPTGDQPLWATQSANTRSGADTWRCKECHGWDYMGVDGAYSSGSHKTGFSGVFDAAAGKSAEELAEILDGTKNPDHDFSAMGQGNVDKLAAFLNEGLIDDAQIIDYSTKTPVNGDAAKGKTLFESTCMACHGADGKMINFHTEEEPEYVGTLANDNPWEFTHKVRSGQPAAPMPSAMVSGWSNQDLADVLAYSQTLPTE